MLRALKKIRLSWPVAGMCVFYLYLGFHALSGKQGIFKWVNYQDEINTLEHQVQRLQREKTVLKTHADQLNAHHLDLDRLGEASRRTLNVSHTNEMVVWLDESP